MSLLNQAFIRAYTRESAGSAAKQPIGSLSMTPSAAASPVIAAIDPPSATIPSAGPHIAFPETAADAPDPEAVTPFDGSGFPDELFASLSVSTFSTPVEAVGDARLETEEDRPISLPRVTFRPAWEVDRFQWPRPCEDLLAMSKYDLGHTIERLRATEPRGRDVLVVTSLMRHEGRSTVALCLARAAVALGLRIALVDGDLDQSRLGTTLGFDANRGWLDVLSGREPLAEAAVASVEDQLTLFPLAGAAHRRSLAWNAELTGNLMRELAAAFDLVVVDSGPLEGPGGWGFDSQELAAGIVAVVVRDVRITSSDQALAAARRLKQCGMRAVGIIENFAGSEGV